MGVVVAARAGVVALRMRRMRRVRMMGNMITGSGEGCATASCADEKPL